MPDMFIADGCASVVARILLETRAVTIRPDSQVTLDSGMKSPVYWDRFAIFSCPYERSLIKDFFVGKIEKSGWFPDVVCGVGADGLAWASSVAQTLDTPFAYFVHDQNSVDKGKIIGRLEPKQSVIVIEDVVSSGYSCLSAVKAIRQMGCEVASCLAVFSYDSRSPVQALSEMGCSFTPLSSLPYLIKEAKGLGLLNDPRLYDLLDHGADLKSLEKKLCFE